MVRSSGGEKEKKKKKKKKKKRGGGRCPTKPPRSQKFVDWLLGVGWLIGWSAGRLIDWQVGRLIDWLISFGVSELLRKRVLHAGPQPHVSPP
jgi:hypothetical protein